MTVSSCEAQEDQDEARECNKEAIEESDNKETAKCNIHIIKKSSMYDVSLTI
jgi:hypothetical protein